MYTLQARKQCQLIMNIIITQSHASIVELSGKNDIVKIITCKELYSLTLASREYNFHGIILPDD